MALDFESRLSALECLKIDVFKLGHFKARKIGIFKLLEHVNWDEARVDVDDVLSVEVGLFHELRQILVEDLLEVQSSNALN